MYAKGAPQPSGGKRERSRSRKVKHRCQNECRTETTLTSDQGIVLVDHSGSRIPSGPIRSCSPVRRSRSVHRAVSKPQYAIAIHPTTIVLTGALDSMLGTLPNNPASQHPQRAKKRQPIARSPTSIFDGPTTKSFVIKSSLSSFRNFVWNWQLKWLCVLGVMVLQKLIRFNGRLSRSTFRCIAINVCFRQCEVVLNSATMGRNRPFLVDGALRLNAHHEHPPGAQRLSQDLPTSPPPVSPQNTGTDR